MPDNCVKCPTFAAMYSRKLYAKIVGSVVMIVLFSLLGAWLFITGLSYTLLLVCLIVILLITLFIIRLMNDVNRRISSFFESLRNNDSTRHYPNHTDDPFLHKLYTEMNRISSLFSENRAEVEEKRLYYESIIRVLTHEIRNSITPIASLSADLLKHVDENNPVQQREGLEVISSQAKSLTAFLDSYHRLTHLPDPERIEIDVRQLFDKLEHLLCAEPDSERVRYVVKGSVTIHADRNLVVLALINLIRNALQAVAGKENGFVTVEACCPGNRHAVITVTDNGPGIPPELLSAIFTPFFSTKSGGSGIGLSISQRIMQLHNGKITASSIPNASTCFMLEF